jgi:glutathione S-transferase
MILRQNKYSPFARKVLVFAHELGLRKRISLQETDPQTDESLRSMNPLSKIPTLLLDDGRAVYDSRVICEYLLARGDAARVAAPADREPWEVARDHALGDGLCDAAVALRGETLRRAAEQSARYIVRQQAAIDAGCDVLAAGVDLLADRVDIGVIAIGCALGYIDLRHPGLDWRAGRDALAEWFAAFSTRESMALTSAAAY